MTAQGVNYSKTEEVLDDGIRLFKIMMRLEFALKDIGFCTPGRRQVAEVHWERYVNERLGLAFWEKIKDAADAEPLIETPPMKQIADNYGNLHWRKSGAVSSIQELIAAMRRVRNNLFHGGKSGDPDADRNAMLYLAALFVIDQILQEDEGLRTSFSGIY